MVWIGFSYEIIEVPSGVCGRPLIPEELKGPTGRQAGCLTRLLYTPSILVVWDGYQFWDRNQVGSTFACEREWLQNRARMDRSLGSGGRQAERSFAEPSKSPDT